MSIYQRLLNSKSRYGGGFLLLLDPDRIEQREYLRLAEAAQECRVDGILVGSSFVLKSNFAQAVQAIKEVTDLPVIIFPGSITQITHHADAILFTSLLSGRNPTYLIDEQVKGAPLIKQAGLEPIPTGYLLIESGNLTSVQYMSGCTPIPNSKYEIAAAHALAAQYLGMKFVYLEAGSGARTPVQVEMIREVASYASIPIIVGGGLHSPEAVAARIDAGASLVVVGNHFENDARLTHLRELVAAAHPIQSVNV
ncbi:MAG: geranylgeranylglyceryl/heptaprenylglyceryl phosphate synthase [candidate division Zixibacteria bacterium]|nr:geranylgeranylglyceryl/heptaprenylglyceryl phosphate synthase [candidate division Zixibacteria bacterium]